MEHVDSVIASADSSMQALHTSKMADSILKDAKQTALRSQMNSSWTYDEQEDKMTSKSNYTASVDANELLDMNFPYNGGVVATLLVQNRRGTNSILLLVSKGQILEPGVKIRFDDGKVMDLEGATPGDGDSKYLFLEPTGRIIANLKKSKKAIIEAQFYDNGLRQMEFNVEGFNWKH